MVLDKANKTMILGAGISGVGAAVLAKKKGYEVFVSDYRTISEQHKNILNHYAIAYEEKNHDQSTILNADIVVKSPGIAENTPIVKKIYDQNIPIYSDIEFGYHFKENSKIIAITGSNGKTTTSHLIYHILASSQYSCSLVGNVGTSFCYELAESPLVDWYVIEVSSFQLDNTHYFKPNIAILLNITADHLDRYDHDIDKYAKSKMKIAQNQDAKDSFIYNDDDELIRKHFNSNINSTLIPFSMYNKPNLRAFVQQQRLKFMEPNYQVWDMQKSDIPLRGKHNQQNVLAATLATRLAKVSKTNIKNSLQQFTGVDHRLQEVATIDDVEFINDSKATNVNSVWYALECMSRPTILIMGGIDKGNNYTFLKKIVKSKVKAIVCLGKDNSRIIEAFSDITHCTETSSMEQAVNESFSLSEKGDAVLLSPACSSFDLFKNYEDRGNQFTEVVKHLKNNEG